MSGFRESKKLFKDVVVPVYTAPSNAPASVSVSVVAPSSCTLFVQSTDIDPVEISSAQSFTKPPSGVWSESFPDVFDEKRGDEGRENVSFQMHFRKTFHGHDNMDQYTQDPSRPYCWQYSEGSATSVVNDDMKTTMARVSTNYNAITMNKQVNTYSGSNDIGWSMAHDHLDYRISDPKITAPVVLFINSQAPRVIWRNDGLDGDSEANNRANDGYIGSCRHIDYDGNDHSSSYTTIEAVYSSAPSYYGSGGVAWYLPDDDKIRSIQMNSNGYMSILDETASTRSDSFGYSYNESSAAFAYNYKVSHSSNHDAQRQFGLGLLWKGSTAANSSMWCYALTQRYNDNPSKAGAVMIPADDASNDLNSTQTRDTDRIEFPELTLGSGNTDFFPIWLVHSGDYYYMALHKQYSSGDYTGGYTDASAQLLYRISDDDPENGTWSEVTNVPAYVDLLPRPIIYADKKMAFAKWSDTTNDRMTNTGHDVDNWESAGLAGMTSAATETWVENVEDFNLDTFSAPNSYVQDALDDNSLTPTGQRTISEDGALYDIAIHTSDTSFRTVSSTFSSRDDNADFTPAISDSFEKTNFIVGAGETIYAHDSKDGAIVHVYGYEDH